MYYSVINKYGVITNQIIITKFIIIYNEQDLTELLLLKNHGQMKPILTWNSNINLLFTFNGIKY